ncbi:MAG: hypothetical protein ACXAC5_15220 [Promethearchaeota archaeon]
MNNTEKIQIMKKINQLTLEKHRKAFNVKYKTIYAKSFQFKDLKIDNMLHLLILLDEMEELSFSDIQRQLPKVGYLADLVDMLFWMGYLYKVETEVIGIKTTIARVNESSKKSLSKLKTFMDEGRINDARMELFKKAYSYLTLFREATNYLIKNGEVTEPKNKFHTFLEESNGKRANCLISALKDFQIAREEDGNLHCINPNIVVDAFNVDLAGLIKEVYLQIIEYERKKDTQLTLFEIYEKIANEPPIWTINETLCEKFNLEPCYYSFINNQMYIDSLMKLKEDQKRLSIRVGFWKGTDLTLDKNEFDYDSISIAFQEEEQW